MLRFTEAALLAAPFAAFIIWRFASFTRIPARILAIASLSVAALGLGLIWFGLGRSLPAGRPYIPARVNQAGAIVSP